ncbi:hypothetical protein [Sphingomonas sp. Leaf21]|uniref:hypothetical protein n=1 Tax=Sphingomonas sp. Leaf21 TaxID=2876550 RepID=UPI001E29C084|nr:hypothetical protein [Sphingomonas sp. Leaf21]
MRRAAPLFVMALTLAACQQRAGSIDDRVAEAEAQDRARQEKTARDAVAQTEDQVRVRMLEQRISALEAQVAAMQGDRKLLDAQLVEQRLNQIEARDAGGPAPSPSPVAPPGGKTAAPARAPAASATPAARKPLVLDLR